MTTFLITTEIEFDCKMQQLKFTVLDGTYHS